MYRGVFAPPRRPIWAQPPILRRTVEIREGQTSDSSGDHRQSSGYLVKNGRYVTIATQHGERALIAIARSLASTCPLIQSQG